MARAGQIQPNKETKSPQVVGRMENISRQARVEELRQLVAKGAYKVSPQRLALKILVKALREQ
jgi:anti-sigma28 factor (negative regulator of flagellin synthesis)